MVVVMLDPPAPLPADTSATCKYPVVGITVEKNWRRTSGVALFIVPDFMSVPATDGEVAYWRFNVNDTPTGIATVEYNSASNTVTL